MSESIDEVDEKIEHKRMTIQISGHVQGVGFRYFARKIAVGMPLAGFIRNDDDGTVTIVAEASEAVLNSFLNSVSVGPAESEVEDVEVNWSMAFGGFEGFSVKLW
jgi:acylphosphatase